MVSLILDWKHSEEILFLRLINNLTRGYNKGAILSCKFIVAIAYIGGSI